MDRTTGADDRKTWVDRYLKGLNVPDPLCKNGYPVSQLENVGPEDDCVFWNREAYESFSRWMFGQTMMICDGPPSEYHIGWLKRMNREHPGQYREYDPENYCDEAHGLVVYTHDLWHYLQGLSPLD